MKQFSLSVFVFCAFHLSVFSQNKGTLEIEATSFRNTKGHMRFAVYNNKAYFLDTKGHYAVGEATIVGDKARARIDLPSGTYAISYMHDENDDSKMEYTLGVPREGFGISNLKSFPFGKPAYEKSIIKIESGKTTYLPVKTFYFF